MRRWVVCCFSTWFKIEASILVFGRLLRQPWQPSKPNQWWSLNDKSFWVHSDGVNFQSRPTLLGLMDTFHDVNGEVGGRGCGFLLWFPIMVQILFVGFYADVPCSLCDNTYHFCICCKAQLRPTWSYGVERLWG